MNTNQVFNPNKSELGIIQTEFSNRIFEQNQNKSKVKMMQINLDWKIYSDLFGLIFYPFSSNEIQNAFRIRPELLEIVRKQIPKWLGMELIRSKWISIRYFRQGRDL